MQLGEVREAVYAAGGKMCETYLFPLLLKPDGTRSTGFWVLFLLPDGTCLAAEIESSPYVSSTPGADPLPWNPTTDRTAGYRSVTALEIGPTGKGFPGVGGWYAWRDSGTVIPVESCQLERQ